MPRLTFAAILSTALGGIASAQIAFHPAVSYPVGSHPEGGTLFDFNNDGRLDLAVTSQQPDKISFLANLGNGTFGAPVVLLAGNTSPEGLAVGDYDGDDDLDLVAALFSSNAVQLVRNDGTGHFVLGPTFAVGIEPSIVVAADFNTDGFPDAAVNNRVSGDVSVLINDQAGGFAPAVNYPVGIETRCVAAADLTGDGLPDLAVSARDSRIVRLFRNLGDGTFATLIDLSLGSILEPEGVVIADLDNDGALDVVTATSGNDQQQHASVFLHHNGGHDWVGPVNGATGGINPMGIVAGDFDLDGHVNIATANADSDTVSALKNGGIGIFFAPVVFAVGQSPEALVLAGGDLDGNGSDDVVSFNRGSGDVSVLINQASDIVPGDVNGDGSVNVSDFLAVLAAWGACAGCPADLDGNGVVNVVDLLIVLGNWS